MTEDFYREMMCGNMNNAEANLISFNDRSLPHIAPWQICFYIKRMTEKPSISLHAALICKNKYLKFGINLAFEKETLMNSACFL